MTSHDERPRCTGTTDSGHQCKSKAAPENASHDQPRCRRHPLDDDTLAHQKKAAAQAKFLETFALVGNVTDACTTAGVVRSTHYGWLQDPDYAERFATAREEAADRLEREALRRAVNGTEKAIYYQGEEVGRQREYSDTLLIFLLKGVRPEKYRERVNVTGQVDHEHHVDWAATEQGILGKLEQAHQLERGESIEATAELVEPPG